MIPTPKEKAEELYSKFYYAIPSDEMAKDEETSKKCALIAVDEILIAIQDLEITDVKWNYWQEVKQEIEAL